MAKYTYSILKLSEAAYTEIRDKLREAGYDHAFQSNDEFPVIDMHGLAVSNEDRT